jgi:hypothetical protein
MHTFRRYACESPDGGLLVGPFAAACDPDDGSAGCTGALAGAPSVPIVVVVEVVVELLPVGVWPASEPVT